MDTIGFGSSREPRHWLTRRSLPPSPRRRGWLAALAAVAAVVAAAVLVATGSRAQRTASPPLPAAPPTSALLRGVPAHGVRTDLFLAGENFLRVTAQPRQVADGFLFNGLSPLLPSGHGAEADQLVPVPGGVVAHISDMSAGITYGAVGWVVFIPAANAPARVIARATMIAVSPDGRQVWVQTALKSGRNGECGVQAGLRSPTWAVNLAGRRVSPVLRLPFGLVAATESGPLTQNLNSGQLQQWNGATGRPIRINLPPDADFVAAGRDQVVWDTCGASCQLHVTDLTTGTSAALPLPGNWAPTSETYPPPPASFDPSGLQLVLPLDRVDSSGNVTAEALFVASTATRTLRMIPGTSLPLSSLPAAQPIQLAGTWDRQGLLWVLASSPDEGYYQLGYWTGAGLLRTFAPASGGPLALTPPGPG